MCWDNFFFAFSGSAAALIGVIFAFIISKLLNIISDYDNLRNETTQLIIERQEIINEISNIPFQWHDKMVIKYDFQLKKQLSESSLSNKTPEEIFEIIKTQIKRPLYLEDKNIEYIKSIIKERNDEIEKRKITTTMNVDGIFQNVTFTPQTIQLPEIPLDDNLWSEINEAEDQYTKGCQKTGIQIYKFNNQKDKIDAKINDFKVIRNILFTFIPITILTVIYPLHFIPIEPDTIPTITFIISRKSGQKIPKIANLQYYKSKANYGTKKKVISRKV